MVSRGGGELNSPESLPRPCTCVLCKCKSSPRRQLIAKCFQTGSKLAFNRADKNDEPEWPEYAALIDQAYLILSQGNLAQFM